MQLSATVDAELGTVYVTGTNVPQSTATVYRYNTDGTTTILRGASNFAVTTGALAVEDPEAPIDVPLRYVLLFNIAANARVVQRNLVVNPSAELSVSGITAGQYRTVTRKLPATISAIETTAVVGDYVFEVSPRAVQPGESAGTPLLAPLLEITPAFTAPGPAKSYEFSFQTHLSDLSSSYYSNSVILAGSTQRTWEEAYSMYRSWNQPFYANLTWAQFETSYIDAYTQWADLPTDYSSATWTALRGNWDPATQLLTLDGAAGLLHAYNHVLNPALTASSAGYTATAASGPLPVLVRAAIDDSRYGLAITTASDTVAPRVSFLATGLTAGAVYYVGARVLVTDGEQLVVTVPAVGAVSNPVVGNSTPSWVSVGTTFIAADATATLQLELSSNVAATTLVTQFQVTVPGVDYLDGGLPDDSEYFYRWTGVPDDSVSERLSFATLLVPGQASYDDYELTWTVEQTTANDIEVSLGVIDASGNDIDTPTHYFVSGADAATSAYGDGVYSADIYGGSGGPLALGETGFGSGAFGAGGFGVDAPAAVTVTQLIHPVNWDAGWRPYVKVSDPGAKIYYSARYRLIAPATYYPYAIPVGARLLDSVGSVVQTSPMDIAMATVGAFTEFRWRFTMPATLSVSDVYRLQIVPEVSLAAMDADWQFDALMVDSEPYQEGRFRYFDGSTPVPSVPVPGWLDPAAASQYDFASTDAVIRWVIPTQPHNSPSEFLGPTQVTAVLETTLGPPVGVGDDDFPDCEPINLTDPTVPSLSGWFTLASISGLKNAARSAVIDVLSRRAPVVISQVRRSTSGTMTLLIQTRSQRQSILDLVASGRVLLLRNPDPSYPESNWYLAIGDVVEERIAPDHRLPYRKISFDFDVVDRPGGLIYRAQPVTWADIDAAYDTWGPDLVPTSVLANAATWSNLISEQTHGSAAAAPMALSAGDMAVPLVAEPGSYALAMGGE